MEEELLLNFSQAISKNKKKIEVNKNKGKSRLSFRKEMFELCFWPWARREGDTGLKQDYEAMACQLLQQMFVNWNTVLLWRDLLINSQTADVLHWAYSFYFPIMHRFMAQYLTCWQMKTFWKNIFYTFCCVKFSYMASD